MNEMQWAVYSWFAIHLFGNTGDGGRNKFVPTIPRLQINSATEAESVAFQDLAVKDLLALLVGQTEHADGQSGLATDHAT